MANKTMPSSPEYATADEDEPEECKNGIKCFYLKCQLRHPAGWSACEDGVNCTDYDCQASHPFKRKGQCRFGNRCKAAGCIFLHPVKPVDKCNEGDSCRRWGCDKWHSKHRPKDCPFSTQCYNTSCEKIHPPGRNPCSQGGECKVYDCPFDHPKSRRPFCQEKIECDNYYCENLHPADWKPCEIEDECEYASHKEPTTVKQSSRTEKKLKDISQREIERESNKLPIRSVKDEFCHRLKKEHVLVVTAETGSGKSTQLPQYCAEYFGGLVVCTQPRLITAMSLARRVAEEYDGTSIGNSVGYLVGQINIGRNRNRVPGKDIIFMTDGMFVQECQDDSFLGQIRVLIIDEAHERSLQTDIVLGIAKVLLIKHPNDFRVVIASATIDPTKFLEFFQLNDKLPLVVTGRLFSVTVENLTMPGKNITTEAVDVVVKNYNKHEGHTLVFLPGQREIEDAVNELNQKGLPNCFGLPLYSALSLEEQDRVLQFNQSGERTRRMVIFCTNIAETSLTIENVRLVIDSGYVKEPNFDYENRMTVIESKRISFASAQQRKGRAGRTAPGHCIRLYQDADLTRLHIEPEILRSSLDRVTLQLIKLGFNPLEFSLMDKPDNTLIQNSLELLQKLEAIDEKCEITLRGNLFARLGVDPRYCAFLVECYLEHEDILELAATIVAILVAPGSAFQTGGLTKEEEKIIEKYIDVNAQKYDSDLLFFASMFNDWRRKGALDPEKNICTTCAKSWKMESACPICRTLYSKMLLFNNKIMNVIENTLIDLVTTIKKSAAGLSPNKLLQANETDIIGNVLKMYFPNQFGKLKNLLNKKCHAIMGESKFPASISNHSVVAHQKVTKHQFMAMSLVKLPGNRYLVDKLHPFNPNIEPAAENDVDNSTNDEP